AMSTLSFTHFVRTMEGQYQRLCAARRSKGEREKSFTSTSADNGAEYFSYEYSWSLLDHSYAPASKVAGLATFCIIILIVAALFLRNAEERDRLRAFISSNTTSSFRVVWHPGKGDDDVVQLVNPNEDMMSEEEDAVPTSFSNMSHEPVFLQAGPTALPGRSDSGPVQIPKGKVISKRWRILRKLGEGGCGAVYKVEDLQTKKENTHDTLAVMINT
ncbi:hypothetical protein TELCIR_12045, partial [Teladorsagia circumcincta]